MLPCYRGFWVSGDGLAALDTKWWWWWWRQDDHYHSPTLSWSFTVKGKCSLIEGKWSPFGGEFWKQIYHLSLAFVHFIKSTRKSWHGSDLPPLSGNARILEVPIPVTYPLFTGRLVGWRKDEGNAGQDTWGWFYPFTGILCFIGLIIDVSKGVLIFHWYNSKVLVSEEEEHPSRHLSLALRFNH